jgi:hypothetical protein
MNAAVCLLCNEQGHAASKCPELVDPLRTGFSKAGGGGGGGHDHDEDERLVLKDCSAVSKGFVAIPLLPLSMKPSNLSISSKLFDTL